MPAPSRVAEYRFQPHNKVTGTERLRAEAFAKRVVRKQQADWEFVDCVRDDEGRCLAIVQRKTITPFTWRPEALEELRRSGGELVHGYSHLTTGSLVGFAFRELREPIQSLFVALLLIAWGVGAAAFLQPFVPLLAANAARIVGALTLALWWRGVWQSNTWVAGAHVFVLGAALVVESCIQLADLYGEDPADLVKLHNSRFLTQIIHHYVAVLIVPIGRVALKLRKLVFRGVF